MPSLHVAGLDPPRRRRRARAGSRLTGRDSDRHSINRLAERLVRLLQMTVLTVCSSLARINIADGTVNLDLAQCAVTDSAHLRSRGLDATGLQSIKA